MDETTTSRAPNRQPARGSASSRRAATTLHACYELTKPGIAGYVTITAGVSAYVASGGRVALWDAAHVMVGTALATAGALALNQYVERVVDAIMVRTCRRPLPSGRLRPGEALALGSFLLVAGVGYLALLSGWLPALLAAGSAAAYHGVYTPLKARSYLATLAGAVPGATPTLIGWGAVAGTLDAGAFALFSIAYLWQLPHVLGLAWMLREDYARVGFRLIPPHDESGRIIGLHMALATSALLPVSLVPTAIGLTGPIYFAGALLASGTFLLVAVRAARDLTDRRAREVFFGSLLYHPVLLGLMLLDTVRL